MFEDVQAARNHILHRVSQAEQRLGDRALVPIPPLELCSGRVVRRAGQHGQLVGASVLAGALALLAHPVDGRLQRRRRRVLFQPLANRCARLLWIVELVPHRHLVLSTWDLDDGARAEKRREFFSGQRGRHAHQLKRLAALGAPLHDLAQ